MPYGSKSGVKTATFRKKKKPKLGKLKEAKI